MVNWCTAVSLLTSLLLCGYIQGQCPGPSEPLCSCISDVATCSRKCIGNSTFGRDFVSQICTGHESVIRNVDLSFNSLNYLNWSCKPSVRLWILNISHNNITIDDCNFWENNCYNAFKYLKYIDLSFNRIKNSCNASAFPLTKLKHVNLSHNKVTSLDNLPFFSNAYNLLIADLSHNNMSYLSSSLFRNKPHLEYVDISYNNFQQVWICNHLLPEPTGVFNINIYKNNISNVNCIVFNNGRHRSCVVSVSVNDSSLWYEDVYCNATDGVDLFQLLNDNNTLDHSYRNKCMYKLLTIPCHIEEVSTTALLTNTHTLQKSTSLHEANVSTSEETTMAGNDSIAIHVTDILLPVICTVTLLSLCLLVFVGLFSLKLQEIIKERQYSQRLKHSVSVDIYEEINRSLRNVTRTLDFSNGTTVSSDEVTRQENYSAIPELEISSVTPSSPNEESVDTYEEPNLAEGYSHPISANGHTLTNAAYTINTLRSLPSHRLTGSREGSDCYYALESSCEDTDKNDNYFNSYKYAEIDGDDLKEGTHSYDIPFHGKFSNRSLIKTKSTPHVLENLFDNKSSLNYSAKTGQCKGSKANMGKIGILDQTIEVGEDILNRVKSASLDMITNSCYVEGSEDMNQQVSMKEESLGHNKSVSLDMLTNPCYAPVTPHKDVPENSQSNYELAILDDHDASQKPQKYDQSFLELKSKSAIELKIPFDENDCLHTMNFFTPDNEWSSHMNTASTNLDVSNEILNKDQIESPEMIMNPWYQPIIFNDENQSSHKSKPSEVRENPFEYDITSSDDLTMSPNPCYMPIAADSKTFETEPTSGVIDYSQNPHVDEDPFDSVATGI